MELDIDPMDDTPRLGWNPYEDVPEFFDPRIKIKQILSAVAFQAKVDVCKDRSFTK